MTKDEFRRWRESFRLTQDDIAKRFGVSRNTVQNWEYGPSPLPGTLADACKVWEDRLRKQIAEIGPVTLCYTDAPMFIEPYGRRGKLATLQQEAYPTNAAALARVRMLWDQPDVHGLFIMEKAGTSLWNQVELMRVVDGSDKGAPTVRNTIAKVAAYVIENSHTFARGRKPLEPAEVEARRRAIRTIGEELEQLASESEERVMEYSEFEPLLNRLHKLGFFPTERQVGDVAHAFQGEKIARAVHERAWPSTRNLRNGRGTD